MFLSHIQQEVGNKFTLSKHPVLFFGHIHIPDSEIFFMKYLNTTHIETHPKTNLPIALSIRKLETQRNCDCGLSNLRFLRVNDSKTFSSNKNCRALQHSVHDLMRKLQLIIATS